MEKRLFDPADAAGPQPDPQPARRDRAVFERVTEAKPLSITELSELIQRTLEDRVPSPLRIVGEVSNFSARNHWYFSLKDDASVISCVVWASAAKRFSFTPADGQEIVATGHVSHYPTQGRTQFYVSGVKPVGEGGLDARFRALCDELRRLGYFDEGRKRRLPPFPRRIAVITSAGGAALQDVLATASQRWRAVRLLVVDVRVQGPGAASEIASAIRRVNRRRRRLGVDAILVTRGGGSLEDLWAFNERVVADAALESDLPIVAAIGHESDTTIIELVADLRAATPTQAVMHLIPNAADLSRQVVHVASRMSSLLKRQIAMERERLRGLERAECLRNPRAILRLAGQRLGYGESSLAAAIAQSLDQRRLTLERVARSLETHRPEVEMERRRSRVAMAEDRLSRAVRRGMEKRDELSRLKRGLSSCIHRRIARVHDLLKHQQQTIRALEVPSVLRRGFSYTTGPDGGILRSIGEVAGGDALTTHLADGAIQSVVRGSRPTLRNRVTKNTARPDQLDLFNS